MVIKTYFDNLLVSIEYSLDNLDYPTFERMVEDIVVTLQNKGRVIATGLGKNVSICEKFVGTMLSLGLDASFMHSNSAVHGDLGMVHEGDLVIMLTKSGRTAESVYLYDFLKTRNAKVWLLTFDEECPLSQSVPNVLPLTLDHEGDKWDIVPNNSATIYFIVLQALAMLAAEKLDITLPQFAQNHPAGAIGAKLRDE